MAALEAIAGFPGWRYAGWRQGSGGGEGRMPRPKSFSDSGDGFDFAMAGFHMSGGVCVPGSADETLGPDAMRPSAKPSPSLGFRNQSLFFA